MTDVEYVTARLVARLRRLGAQRQLAELEGLKQMAESYGVDFQAQTGAGLLAMQTLLIARLELARRHHRRPKALSREQLYTACRALALALEETHRLNSALLVLFGKPKSHGYH